MSGGMVMGAAVETLHATSFIFHFSLFILSFGFRYPVFLVNHHHRISSRSLSFLFVLELIRSFCRLRLEGDFCHQGPIPPDFIAIYRSITGIGGMPGDDGTLVILAYFDLPRRSEILKGFLKVVGLSLLSS